MTITSFDDFITALANGYYSNDCFYKQYGSTATTVHASQLSSNHVFGTTPFNLKAYPTLPGGKTYYTPTTFEVCSSTTNRIMFAKLTLMGTLDISTPTFTDGSAAPTITEGGTSRQIPSAVLVVVTTALNATPGAFTITYQDQDGNTAETNTSINLTASAVAGSCGYVPLNTGDWGAIDVTNATRTGGTTPTGVLKFYHVRPVCAMTVPATTSNNATSRNMLTDAARLFKFAATDSLSIIATGTATHGCWGRVINLAL